MESRNIKVFSATCMQNIIVIKDRVKSQRVNFHWRKINFIDTKLRIITIIGYAS